MNLLGSIQIKEAHVPTVRFLIEVFRGIVEMVGFMNSTVNKTRSAMSTMPGDKLVRGHGLICLIYLRSA